MKYEQAMRVAGRLAEISGEIKAAIEDQPDGSNLEEITESLLGVDLLIGETDSLLKMLTKERTQLNEAAVPLFIDLQVTNVSRHGKTIYVAREYWPGPDASDLIPQDASEAEIGAAKERAAERLRCALKGSADFSYLVKETLNSVSLRSAITGEDAPRDENGTPIVPPELVGLLSLNPKNVVRVRKAGR